jgi:tRNA threonylcarbamoyladenosine biosynthesis protein TsaE
VAQPSFCQEWSHLSHSPEETRALGARLGALLRPGDLLLFAGTLGAGKTTLVQGLALGLGLSGPVTSPSFALVHEYPGRLRLYHLDLYRLTARDLPELGIDEMLDGEGVVVVEWSERLPAGFGAGALSVELAFAEDPEARLLRFLALSPRPRCLLQALAEAHCVR